MMTLIVVIVSTTYFAIAADRNAQRLMRKQEQLHGVLVDLLVTHVLNADASGVSDTIKLAELAGVPPDLLHTLKGLAGVYTDDVGTALSDLEQAAAAAPEDLTLIRALGVAYMGAGRFGKAWWIAVDLTERKAVPETDIDTLPSSDRCGIFTKPSCMTDARKFPSLSTATIVHNDLQAIATVVPLQCS